MSKHDPNNVPCLSLHSRVGIMQKKNLPLLTHLLESTKWIEQLATLSVVFLSSLFKSFVLVVSLFALPQFIIICFCASSIFLLFFFGNIYICKKLLLSMSNVRNMLFDQLLWWRWWWWCYDERKTGKACKTLICLRWSEFFLNATAKGNAWNRSNGNMRHSFSE